MADLQLVATCRYYAQRYALDNGVLKNVLRIFLAIQKIHRRSASLSPHEVLSLRPQHEIKETHAPDRATYRLRYASECDNPVNHRSYIV
jgi:hypothetical protein